MLKYYKILLGYYQIPEFLMKYLDIKCIRRLKKVGYFCGMDFASKEIYQFREYISRYDHSLTVALMVWKLTKDKVQTLAALFHDVATPCFSHVIDYMNKDYENQESTEIFTRKIIEEDDKLCQYLKDDDIDIDNVINFKKFLVVDNDRPKICADRLDGIILTGIGWTKNITRDDIKVIIDNIDIVGDNEEIGFLSEESAELVYNINLKINQYCHSYEDNYMMELLAELTRKLIQKGIISYNDLYALNEEEIFEIIKKREEKDIVELFHKFQHVKKSEIPSIELKNVKQRIINPFILDTNQRLKAS